MGNCIDNNQQVVNQDAATKPVPTQGQYGQTQQMNNIQNEENSGRNDYARYNDQAYKSYDKGQDLNQNNYNSAYDSMGKGRKNIDFDRIGSNFVFFEDARKYFDDSPWQRDENDNSNRPSELAFANNQRQPLANGLATRVQQSQQQQLSNANSSLYAISNINHNQSMNRSIDKGYSQSIVMSNRKKQNIFYDASTYNQNPYVKTTHEKASPNQIQSVQQPYLNFSAISYR